MLVEIWEIILAALGTAATTAGGLLIALWLRSKSQKRKDIISAKNAEIDIEEKEIEVEHKRADRAWNRAETLEQRLDRVEKELLRIKEDWKTEQLAHLDTKYKFEALKKKVKFECTCMSIKWEEFD